MLFCAHCLVQNNQPLRFDAASIKLSFDVASIRRPERDEMIAREMDILSMLQTESRAPAADSKPIVHGQHVDMNLVSVRDLVSSAY